MTEHLQLFRSQGGAGYIDIFIGQRLDIGLRRHIAGSISQQKSVKKVIPVADYGEFHYGGYGRQGQRHRRISNYIFARYNAYNKVSVGNRFPPW